MSVDHLVGQPLGSRGGESQLLTAKIVMPAVGDNANDGTSLARLLVGLTVLALERFGAARENQCQAATEESLPCCLAGVPVDPFDGQLLRCRNTDSGYEFHSIHSEERDDSGWKSDLARTVVTPAE
jgi:hypothetical protein